VDIGRKIDRRTFVERAGLLTLATVAPSSLLSEQRSPAGIHVLENSKIRVVIDGERGGIVQITNPATGESHKASSQPFFARTTLGAFGAGDCRITRLERKSSRLEIDFAWEGFRVTVTYTLEGDAHFLEKEVRIAHEEAPFGLIDLSMERIRFAPGFCHQVKHYCTGGRGYSSFYDMCPVCLFLRGSKGGVFMGIENPVFRMEDQGGEYGLAYEVGLEIKAGESYVSEPEFLGVYRVRGKEYHYEEFKRGVSWTRDTFALPPNPDSSVLDWGEIEAMQQCVERRSPAYSPGCVTVLNNWASANYTSAWEEYQQVMLSAKKLGIRSLMFADVFGLSGTDWRPPLDFWRNPQADPNLDRVYEFAKRIGLQLGGYFSPCDRGAGRWKSDHLSDQRRDWIVERSSALIKKYDIGWWGNDFMEFNARDEAKDHGHITPQGAVYMQWRNLVGIYRTLRQRFPQINIGLFGGLTSCGPWSLQYADYANLPGNDSHPNVFCPFPDIHYDHLYGNEERMRSWYGHNLLFYPPFKCRYSVGHLGQDGLHVWGDPDGWRYNVLGAIGTSTILEHAYIPIGAELKDEDVNFVKKWTDWADRNIAYLRVRRDLFGEPAIGRVDGYAHVIKDRGFVFLFNPNHRAIAVKIPLNEWVGLTEGDRLMIKELYPREGCNHFVDHDGGLAVHGRDLVINVPPQNVQVLELLPAEPSREEATLFGVAGKVRLNRNAELEIEDAIAEEGEEVTVGVRFNGSKNVTSVKLNGQAIPFRETTKGAIACRLKFEGERIQREIENWTGEGREIEIPNLKGHSQLKASAKFYLPRGIRQLLEGQRPQKKYRPEDLLPAPTPEGGASANPTNLWGDPYERIPTLDRSRLLITLPTTYPEAIKKVRAWLNGSELQVRRFESCVGERIGPGRYDKRLFCHYLDVRGECRFGEHNVLEVEFEELLPGQFLGAYIENVPVQLTKSVKGIEIGDSSPVAKPRGIPLEAFPA
jgi:hypothetical protein